MTFFTVLVGLLVWVCLDIVLVLIWSHLCRRGERARLAEGSLILVAPSAAEDAAIERARGR